MVVLTRTKSLFLPASFCPPQPPPHLFFYSFSHMYSHWVSRTSNPLTEGPRRWLLCAALLPTTFPHLPGPALGPCITEIAQRRHPTWGVHTPPSPVTLKTLFLLTWHHKVWPCRQGHLWVGSQPFTFPSTSPLNPA